MRDDLGFDVPVPYPPRRVVSLVPSITEAIATTAPGVLVGATDWCTHPSNLAVARVRGPKNPDLAQIRELHPDLVVANQEENRRPDVDQLRVTNIPVWVTRMDTICEALTSLTRLFTQVFGLAQVDWLDQARQVWQQPVKRSDRLRVAIPVWRDPWIWVGASTYPHDLVTHLGLDNVITTTSPRYPHHALDEVLRQRPDLVLLPDEPYSFTSDDGPKVFDPVPCVLLPGRDLFWYGPAMVNARQNIELAINALL